MLHWFVMYASTAYCSISDVQKYERFVIGYSGMTHLPNIWDCIRTNMPRHQWVELSEIYSLVGKSVLLDRGDHEPQSPTSALPKWKRNVRNVLQYRKHKGDIEWNGSGKYRL
jgi:hypothetical protein